MPQLLAVAIVGLPVLASSLVALVMRSARPVLVHRLVLAVVSLTLLLGLALLPHTGDHAVVAVEWLPGAGLIGLTVGATSLYVVLATTGAAVIALLGTASRSAERPSSSGAVTLLGLGAANAAFLADHFLGRYVALEVVALCIALAPIVERLDPVGIRLAWRNYLLLRIGDAGMLIAILVLGDAAGTLSIGSALAAGEALEGARLGWVVAGFALAGWVKLGGWPFHLWSQTGQWLSLASQTWLYATVVPNLGTYLFYGIAPLLTVSGSMRAMALWVGAGGAALAAVIALTQPNPRKAMVYVGAAQGGLALFGVAAGIRSIALVSLLVLTPVRLLLFLTIDAARAADSRRQRGLGVLLLGLGAMALAAFSLLIPWWVRHGDSGVAGGEGVPLDMLFVAETAAALTVVWGISTVWRLARRAGSHAPNIRVTPETQIDWSRWAALLVLGGGVLAGGAAFGPLFRHLMLTSYSDSLPLPSIPAALRYAATTPALLAVFTLSLAARRLMTRSRWEYASPEALVEDTGALEEGLTRAAQALRTVVEAGIAEQIITVSVRSVVNGARLAWTVEHSGLEGLVSRTAQTTAAASLGIHRVVERDGLEGLLRNAVRGVLALSRFVQRRHSGRLRRNLLWVPVLLVVAVLVLIRWGW